MRNDRYETGWKRERVDFRMIQYMVDTVLRACCTRWTLHSVYAVLCVNIWCSHGDIERDDICLHSPNDGWIEDEKEHDERRWGRIHHENLRHKWIGERVNLLDRRQQVWISIQWLKIQINDCLSQSGRSNSGFLISPRFVHIIPFFIPHHSFSSTTPPLSQQHKVQSSQSVYPGHD